MDEELRTVPLSELYPFSEQPFKVQLDAGMDELAESIRQSGVLSPIIARPREGGGYEILSGHRRVKACEIAGIKEAPVMVRQLDDDAAVILLVDSNLQRENILLSEKAFAYQMKLEAMKRQGKRTDLTSGQIGPKLEKRRSNEVLSEISGESVKQIQRYIRLTNLITPLLDMVDRKEIALSAAVELSYLGSKAQSEVLKVIEQDCTAPSISQAGRIRQFYQEDKLSPAVIEAIMREEKPEKAKLTFKTDKIRKYFPRGYTPEQMEETVIKLLENWSRKRKIDKER